MRVANLNRDLGYHHLIHNQNSAQAL
uniref:Uncharacterized protein n=1 Tax=Arundo donax TaxID=35708 RepID=A0A0A9FX18_ARUDO